jgi:hypothetical protein
MGEPGSSPVLFLVYYSRELVLHICLVWFDWDVNTINSDIMFILASKPPPLLRGKAHQLLIVAPVVEGLLGGWSTLQGATQALV